MLSRLPDSLAHCLQVHRQKANMKTGFSLQWPLLAQFSQDELWSSHPLCITADKEIIAMLFMPMHWLFKTKVHGNTLTRKCRRVKVSGNRFEQFYFGGSPQLLLLNSRSWLVLRALICHVIGERSRGGPITGVFSNRTPVIGYPRDFHVNYAGFNGFLNNVFYSFQNLGKALRTFSLKRSS